MVQVILFVMFAFFAHTAHAKDRCFTSMEFIAWCYGDAASCNGYYPSLGANVCGGSGGYVARVSARYSGDCCYQKYYCCDNPTTCDQVEYQCAQDPKGVFNPQTCECTRCTDPDTTFKESSCAYDPQQGKYLNIVNTIQRTNCEVTVKEDKYYSLTCDTTCNENSELTCMGSIDGVTVYLRSCNGKVSRCEADGSCDAAIRKVASGECENPNDPPNPSSSAGGSSSSEQGSSSSGSGGNPADSLGWLKDTLRVIHITDSAGFAEVNNNLENIQPFIMGTYDQVTDLGGTVHDINSNLLTSFEFLSDIKENTGNTAQNTNSINNKLTNTNQLLTELNDKDWNVNVRPEITVEGDTNIVNVQTDTAKSGAAILDFLKGIFNGADTTNNYNPNDTAGKGRVLDSLLGKIGDLVSDSGYMTVRDSVGVAVTSMRGSYNALKDTLAHSAINDSLNRWNDAITNNGVITGNGSDNCPSILERDWDLNFGLGVTITAGHLGRYICTPIGGLNISIWALCRVLLRAIVAICCMIWLYKTVLGIDGGSNEED